MNKIINSLIPEYQSNFDTENINVFERYKKTVYCLAWFHSLLNERKRFSSLGWNYNY